MDFAAFLLLNAVLYIRPTDFAPGLVLPLYEATFGLCLLLPPGTLDAAYLCLITSLYYILLICPIREPARVKWLLIRGHPRNPCCLHASYCIPMGSSKILS